MERNYNIDEATEGYYNGPQGFIDPNDMATDEDAVERKKVSLRPP